MSTEADQDWSKLKVVQLKAHLKDLGLAVVGKKDELVQRLTDHYEQQQQQQQQPLEPSEQAHEAEPELEPAHDDAAAPVEAAAVDDSSVQEVEITTQAAIPQIRSAESLATQNGHNEQPKPKRAKLDIDLDHTALAPPTPPPPSPPPAPETKQQELREHKAHAPHGEDDHGSKPKDDPEEPPDYDLQFQAIDDQDDSTRPTDLYLDTINRHALDFDFERLCSVTLSQNNIYACLVDGKYFQGRGKSSPAYAHSIAEDHHVFINLTTQKVHVLPDGYQVNDPSLDDIKYHLFPTFAPTLLQRIDAAENPSYDLAQKPYYPGFVGLNNIKTNSYMNCILHALVHVTPLRNYFILDPHVTSSDATELVRRFSMLCRKIWNPRAFKAQVSPHELLQECANASAKRFKITQASDPLEFLGWLLNALHRDLGGNKKPKSSVIYSAFQGEVRVDDQQVLTTGEYGGKPRFDLDRGTFRLTSIFARSILIYIFCTLPDIKSTTSPFLFLAIDLPPPPVFQDSVETNIIPQVPISAVLAKYDGRTTQESKGTLRRWKLTRLPPFLILHIKRFTKNNFVEEKNPTIVNFPLRGVDMADYVEGNQSIAQYYDLVSNITHSSAAGTAREETTWKVNVHLRTQRDLETGKLSRPGKGDDDEKWYAIQDLIVEEINQQLIPLGESYIQIWERRGAANQPLVVEKPKPKSTKI
ncbi:BZ3500_MvSof-1268-A1-R1_Chr7-2g09514 [Microbotryum saponariae]|uniref:BZ3500_MvSof-1268-A1-R1_Chr7-2g09514 protein n=1 Tax=Microbotryum saponariae TaxID=289078 RepID=A0A2X0L1S3_9BASI|nr:BZ3501_MvSof-1269-A2-R1_Chr7-1g09214 [Microbotryum saponariae]SDA02605.1 BZ3500_MvSof-1268-A1-R1_Chr7-2g09514 [Microbotryum saponariae]